MPVRLLRDGILDSDAVCSLSFPSEVFYRRLMSAVDDFGRFDGRVNVLKSRLYPLQTNKVREADISRWIAECEKAGLIALYAVEGKPYILFHKLGEPRAQKSKYPPPPEVVCKHLKADESNGKQVLSDVPYSPSPSPSISDAGTGPSPPPPAKPKSKHAIPERHPLFARFWEAYPRKAEEHDAAVAFAEIVADDDEAFLQVMLEAIAWQKKSPDWTDDAGKYIHKPANWLRKAKWQDQPPEVLKAAPRTPAKVYDKPD